MVKQPVYLDYNATTPVDPRVMEAMIPFFTTHFGNAASRSHLFGREASRAVEAARAEIANLICAEPQEIIFTSGATEAVNLALKGAFEMYRSRGNHIVTAATEHKAVLDTCERLKEMGAEVTFLPIDTGGLIDLQDFESAIKSTTILVCLMFANNETGVLQQVKELAEIAHKRGAIFFSDATQAVGKIPVDVNMEGIDLMAFSAHKMYGPKGVGALFVRRKNPRVRLIAQIDGGGHERGMRSGTLNVAGIIGFGKACELCHQQMKEEGVKLEMLRNIIERELADLPETNVNGHPKRRLPHVSNITFRHIESAALIQDLLEEIAISSGSACSSASAEPSHVLQAMGLSKRDSNSAIRISLGRFTTGEEVEKCVQLLKNSVERLRSESPVWKMFSQGRDPGKFDG